MSALFAAIIAVVLSVTNPVSAEHYYVIEKGDTLYEIAGELNISWEEIAKLNKISDPTKLRIGQTLVLPAGVRMEGSYIYAASAGERDLLARVIHAEARGESMAGQIAVGAVILNRVRSEEFPDTITEVVYQPGQFTPVENGILPETPNANAKQAAERALQGEDPTNGALFFFNPVTTRNPKFWETRPVIKKIGNHNFTL